MERQVLLLNASEEVLNVIDWKKAVSLIESGKAIQPACYEEIYTLRTTRGRYTLPKAIMLMRYIRIPYKKSMPTRRNIFKRDRHTCQYCGKVSKNPKNLTIDHVTPRSRGGDSSWTNLVTACPSCNCKKANKKPKECGMPLKSKPKKPMWNELYMNNIEECIISAWTRWIKKN